ncbi:MAG: hypothetical protein HY921_09235 [Elusimicrobia bacterium]|nr:hypothetical protein [Elusimicrobiota bacterium]
MVSKLGRQGQIVIPALFIFPSLFLFIFLIFETAKLSQQKIRHQFAVDAAAFVELTNYSDFLNRSAYVNGAFPMRIFYEGFHGETLDCQGKDPCPGPTPIDEILYKDGVFPRSLSDAGRTNYGEEEKWDIGYGGARSDMNSSNPEVASRDCIVTGKGERPADGNVGGTAQDNCFTLISMETAKHWWINWDDANQIYKLYVQIYQLLGSVESAQFSVLRRLSDNHNFLKKSYWLNTGDDPQYPGRNLIEADQAVANFRNVADTNFPLCKNCAVKFSCVQNLLFHGNQFVHSTFQQYKIFASDPPPQMPKTIDECEGLFQLVTVKPNAIKSLTQPSGSGYPGWPVEVHWMAPKNYFGVDFNRMAAVESGASPKVHATVALEGKNPSVWPEPTPRFQVRLYP